MCVLRLEQHTTPEIFRTPLHELCLSIKLLRLGPIGQFMMKAVEPPPVDAVIEAEALLRGLSVSLSLSLSVCPYALRQMIKCMSFVHLGVFFFFCSRNENVILCFISSLLLPLDW